MGKTKLLLAVKPEVPREGLRSIIESEPNIELVIVCSTGTEAIESALKYEPNVVVIDDDLLEFDGQQIVNEPYEKRKGILNEKFKDYPGIQVVKDWEDPFECWKFVIANKLEGIVEKDKSSFYRTGRNDAGIKVKRKGLFEMRFEKYYIQNAGITLENKEGFRVACNGQKHVPVKELMDKQGYVDVILRAMADKTENDKLREIVFYSIKE